jgi:cytochrome c peroxidase
LYEYYPDSGRTRITNDTNDRGKIKTPTLRNVALTAPYMHDGSIQTVEEVISHFASGGKSHSQKSDLIVDFEISEKEKAELLSFLSSLTDKTFISDTTLSNPF